MLWRSSVRVLQLLLEPLAPLHEVRQRLALSLEHFHPASPLRGLGPGLRLGQRRFDRRHRVRLRGPLEAVQRLRQRRDPFSQRVERRRRRRESSRDPAARGEPAHRCAAARSDAARRTLSPYGPASTSAGASWRASSWTDGGRDERELSMPWSSRAIWSDDFPPRTSRILMPSAQSDPARRSMPKRHERGREQEPEEVRRKHQVHSRRAWRP